MRNSPYYLALFAIFITVVRIAMFVFVIDKGYGEMLGRLFAASFAFVMAGGTYLSAFAVRFRNSRFAGIVGVILFGTGDLIFNEAAVVYVTSSAILVPPESSFLGYTAGELIFGLQVLVLVFGAFPTLGAASLGFMQSSFYEVKELNKPGVWSKVGRGFVKWAATFGIQVGGGKVSEKVSGKKSESSKKYDWRLLSDDTKAEIVGKDVRNLEIMFPGIERKTAENWFFRANGYKVSESKRLK